MPVLDFQADDALRVAEQSVPLPGAQSSKSEWDKLQTSIASLQALGVLKEKPPEKRQRRASLPPVNTFQTASSGLEVGREMRRDWPPRNWEPPYRPRPVAV